MSIKKIFKIDFGLLLAVSGLISIGIIALASSSAVFSLEQFGKTGYYFIHQLFYGIIPGIFLGIIAFFLPLSFYKKGSFIFILFALILMMMVFIPGFGLVSGGALRWLKIGPFSFQPSEILKLSFIIYLSSWLSNRIKAKPQKDKNWKITLIPFFCILGFIFLLFYFQSNASTLGLILSVGSVMYFLSGTPLWHMLILGLGGLAMSGFMIVFEPYRIRRVLVALNILKDPMGAGYQVKQSLIAIGSGGITGIGLGISQQKFGNYLPQTMSDSIFSIFAEETGFIGCLALILLFIFFFYKCIRIAFKSNDKFSQLFAIGTGVWICLQSFINIGAMIQLFPLTGIPLPFISYGGSHIFMELTAVGILFNISKHNQA